MAYPILAPSSTWFNNSFIKRDNIRHIIIKDSIESTKGKFQWDGSQSRNNSITIIYDDTTQTLYICGNGSGKISLNKNSDWLFSSANKEYFINLESITGLDLMDTDNVEILSHICWGCQKLKQFIAPTWTAPNNTSLLGAFGNCFEIEKVLLNNMDTRKVTSMKSSFGNCRKITTIGIDQCYFPMCVDYSFAFYYCKSVESVSISLTKSCTSIQKMFTSCEKLNFVNTNEWDTSGIIDMSFAFSNCPSLKTIDVSKWDVSKVTTMNGTFSNGGNEYGYPREIPEGIESIDVSHWDVSSCKDMSFMFWGKHPMKKLDVRNWDVSKVENFDHFLAHNIYLYDFDTSKWRTSSATNLYAMFHSTQMSVIDVSHFNTSKVTVFGQMFENTGCRKIIGHENFDTSKGIDFVEMFARSSVEELDLSGYDTSHARVGDKVSENGGTAMGLKNMFACNGVTRLKKLILGPKFKFNGDGSFSEQYSATIPATQDGKWYTIDGIDFTPEQIKTQGANTYYASLNTVKNMVMFIKNETLIDIAKALRTVNGLDKKYKPSEISGAILALKK